MHNQRSIVIPSPWPVTNPTIYSTLPIYTVIFNIGNGVESIKLGLFAKFHAQLVGLVAWQVPKTHQGTHQRSHHNMVFSMVAVVLASSKFGT